MNDLFNTNVTVGSEFGIALIHAGDTVITIGPTYNNDEISIMIGPEVGTRPYFVLTTEEFERAILNATHVRSTGSDHE